MKTRHRKFCQKTILPLPNSNRVMEVIKSANESGIACAKNNFIFRKLIHTIKNYELIKKCLLIHFVMSRNMHISLSDYIRI